MLREEDIINGMQYHFRTDYCDYVDLDCGDCIVTIIRPLEDIKEIDKSDVGPMWLAKSENGYDLNVYLDELEPIGGDSRKKKYGKLILDQEKPETV